MYSPDDLGASCIAFSSSPSASVKRRWRRKMSARVRCGAALVGSSEMAFWAASTAFAGSLARASHCASCTQRAAVSRSRSMAWRRAAMASWFRPARAFIWAME